MMLRESFRNGRIRTMTEYYTLGTLHKIKRIFWKSLETVQKNIWASQFFFATALVLAIMKIYVIMTLSLIIALYFHVRHTLKSGEDIHDFRRRYKNKVKEQRET